MHEHWPLFDRFPEATKLHPPELGETEELLQKQVPFTHRAAHYVPYINIDTPHMDSNTAARTLGLSTLAFEEYVDKVGARQFVDESTDRILPHMVYEVIEAELEYDRAYVLLEPFQTGHAIGQFLGRSDAWVRKVAHDLNEFAVHTFVKNGRERMGYQKSVISKLRHVILSYMPDGDWFSKSELIDAIGHDWPWIQARLDAKDIVPEKRWSSLNGRIYDYFPPETLDMLLDISSNQPPPAGNWLTVEGIARLLGKSTDWVEPRIAAHRHLAQVRLDDHGRENRHFPNEVVLEISKIANVESTVPPLEDYLAVSGIARAVGKSYGWVKPRLALSGFIPELRKFPSGQIVASYDPAVVAALRAMIE